MFLRRYDPLSCCVAYLRLLSAWLEARNGDAEAARSRILEWAACPIDVR